MSNIIAQGTNLGSILLADTFFYFDDDTHLNITLNVPLLQFWYTTNKHYSSLPQPIQTEKNLQCERLGARLSYLQDLQGLLPVKEPLNELFADVNLQLKLVFYERGLIMVDQRLYCFVFAYEDIDHLLFYVDDEMWIEIKVK